VPGLRLIAWLDELPCRPLLDEHDHDHDGGPEGVAIFHAQCSLSLQGLRPRVQPAHRGGIFKFSSQAS